MAKMSEAQMRDLRQVGQGYNRGEHAGSCEALCRRGLLRGDWVCGYDLTAEGRRLVAEAVNEAPSAWLATNKGRGRR